MLRIAIPVGLTLIFVLPMIQSTGTTSLYATDPHRPTQLHRALFESGIGPKLDVYFTMERTRSTPKRRSPFDSTKWVLDFDDVHTVDQLVDRLHGTLEKQGIHAIRSKDQPQIIHLIESPLINREGYVLNQRLTLKYSGKLDRLAEALGKQVPGLGPKRVFGMPTDDYDDNVTTVDLDAKNMMVRQILSKSLPLDRYSEILWKAETDLEGVWKNQGGTETVVWFGGPKQDPLNDDQ